MEKMRKKKGDTGRAILFLAPALLLICCFTVIPIFEAVYTSFHKTQYAMVGEFVGLKNYISVMVESDGLKNIINSIVYVVLSLLLAMPIGIGVGTLLNRKIRGMTIFRTMIIIPWTLSQTVTALLWKWLLNGNYGLITSWAYQLTGKKMDLFSSAIIAKILVVIVNVFKFCTSPFFLFCQLCRMNIFQIKLYFISHCYTSNSYNTSYNFSDLIYVSVLL